MERETFDATIASFQKREPFQPFTVTLINGQRHEVDHPGAIVYRDGVAIYVAPGGIPVIFDHEGVTEIIGDLAGQSSE